MIDASSSDELREQVRERYAAAATTVTTGDGNASCCGDSSGCCGGATVPEVDDRFDSTLYAASDTDSLPVASVAASLGCGNPIAVAELGGRDRPRSGLRRRIDVLLSARRVGPTGFAYGVDMTDEMLDLARAMPPRHRPPTLNSSRAPSRTSRCPMSR